MKYLFTVCLSLIIYSSMAQVLLPNKNLFETRLNFLFQSITNDNMQSIEALLHENVSVSGYKKNTAVKILQSLPLQTSAPQNYTIDSILVEKQNYRLYISDNEKQKSDYLFSPEGIFLEINMIDVVIKKQEDCNAPKLTK